MSFDYSYVIGDNFSDTNDGTDLPVTPPDITMDLPTMTNGADIDDLVNI
ncbi:hypothetical protein [Bacteroides caecimuris]|nr:hypothetical protein [Bacteroides caecimuris]